MVVEKFSIVRMNRYQLKPLHGATLHTVGQHVKQKNYVRTKSQVKLIGFEFEQIKVLGNKSDLLLDDQQHPLNGEQKAGQDSFYQILDDFSLTGGKQNLHVDKKQELTVAKYQSVGHANEKGLGSTITHNHHIHHKQTEQNNNNKTEEMRVLSGSSLLLKRKNTVRKHVFKEGVDNANLHAINKVDLGYMTCSSKETLSEIDEEIESDFDEETESDTSDNYGEHFFSARRIRNTSNKYNTLRHTDNHHSYRKVSMERSSVEQSICLSTSPFALSKAKGMDSASSNTKRWRLGNVRSTLTSDLTIYGRNPVDVANENHQTTTAKKDRVVSADCTRTFHFKIEKRKVFSIRKETVAVPSSIKKDERDVPNNNINNINNNNNNNKSNSNSNEDISPCKVSIISNNKTLEESREIGEDITPKDFADEERGLDAQTYMYIGLASARSCRNKRRRHSFDHIRNQRQRNKSFQRKLLVRRGSDTFSDEEETSTDLLGRSGHQQYTTYTQTTKRKNSFQISMPDIHYDRHQCNDELEREDQQSLEHTSKMRMLEQDLGSDAESLPSCEESLTNSENSPPGSPQAFKKKLGVNRRESAPASINAKFINDEDEVTKEMAKIENHEGSLATRESHRRYSSVEERTSRVRFKFEESFKEEENRYEKQFDDQEEEDLRQNFSDIEPFKVLPPSSLQYSRKVSCPPCLSCDIEEVRQESQQNFVQQPRKDSTESRTRKCSVYSDNSGSIQILPGQTIRKVSSKDNLISEEEIHSFQHQNYHRKTSLQEQKARKTSRVENRKASLQENCGRKVSINTEEKPCNESSRKFSLQIPRRRQSFSDRKLSLQERRKQSTAERKLSTDNGKYSSRERKASFSEKKHSVSERKTSQPELRKISLTDTFRAVVGTKKKTERKKSQEVLADENNNMSSDKKSAWGLIKNKIKKDRKSSNDAIQQGSPRMIRLLSRNDSSSSLDSGTPKRNRRRTYSADKRSPRSEEYDQKSISSYNSMDLEDEPDIVPQPAFDLWSDGKVEIDTDCPSLPLLHVAAAEGNKELCRTLVDVGVDINELDHFGWPALHYAVCSGHFDCAQLLLSKGATLNSYSNRVMNTYCTAIRDCIRTGSPHP